MKEKITKDQVLKALELIENYRLQGLENVKQIEKESDTRSLDWLGLENSTIDLLSLADIKTVGGLLVMGRYDLKKFRNMGIIKIKKINKALKDKEIDKVFIDW